MDALDIEELANQLESDYSNQNALDRLMLDQYLQRHVIETSMGQQQQGPNVLKPVAIGSGYIEFLVDQDFTFLSSTPFLRVNSPDQKQDKKAQKVEEGLGGLWRLSQGYVDVWRKLVKDFVLFGRGVSNVYANPADWADLPNADDEDEYKREHFPILWRHVDARGCWPVKSANGDIDQVVEVRSMSARQIERRYGKEAIDTSKKKYGPREEIRVVEYADTKMCYTVVCSSSPTLVYEYEHGLGCNPYVFAESPQPPPNEYGYRWTGATFGLRNSITEIDGRLSDINWNIRQSIRSTKLVGLDPEQRQSIESGGEPPNLTLSPDASLSMWNTEWVKTIEPAQTNVDVFQFIQLMMAFTKEAHVRPVLTGALQAGTSGVLYNTAVQLAEKEYGPALDALKLAAEQVGRRLLKAVKVMSTSGGAGEDKVPIVYIGGNNNAYSLSLSASDVKGFEPLLQARMSVAVPLNEQAQIATARLATSPDNPIMSPETAMARYAAIENPQNEIERIHSAQLVNQIMNSLGQAASERALGIVQAPTSPADELQSRIGNLPPSFQQAVLMHAQNLGQPINLAPAAGGGQRALQGNMNRGAANSVRTGVQQPSQTESVGSQSYG